MRCSILRDDCVRLACPSAYPPRTGNSYSATPIIRLPAITQVPMSDTAQKANLLLNRSGTQTVLRLGDRRRTSMWGVQQRRGALGFAHQPGRVKWERCVIVPHRSHSSKEYLVFIDKSLIFGAPVGAHSPCSNHIPSTSGILAPDFRSKRCTEPGATRSAT